MRVGFPLLESNDSCGCGLAVIEARGDPCGLTALDVAEVHVLEQDFDCVGVVGVFRLALEREAITRLQSGCGFDGGGASEVHSYAGDGWKEGHGGAFLLRAQSAGGVERGALGAMHPPAGHNHPDYGLVTRCIAQKAVHPAAVSGEEPNRRVQGGGRSHPKTPPVRSDVDVHGLDSLVPCRNAGLRLLEDLGVLRDFRDLFRELLFVHVADLAALRFE